MHSRLDGDRVGDRTGSADAARQHRTSLLLIYLSNSSKPSGKELRIGADPTPCFNNRLVIHLLTKRGLQSIRLLGLASCHLVDWYCEELAERHARLGDATQQASL